MPAARLAARENDRWVYDRLAPDLGGTRQCGGRCPAGLPPSTPQTTEHAQRASTEPASRSAPMDYSRRVEGGRALRFARQGRLFNDDRDVFNRSRSQPRGAPVLPTPSVGRRIGPWRRIAWITIAAGRRSAPGASIDHRHRVFLPCDRLRTRSREVAPTSRRVRLDDRSGGRSRAGDRTSRGGARLDEATPSPTSNP